MVINNPPQGHGIPLGEPKWWSTVYQTVLGFQGTANQAGVADRVWMAPIWLPRGATISRLSMRVNGAGAGGTNLRLGLYADNGATPVGGALLEDSGNIAADSTGVKTFTLSTPRALGRGISSWFALITEDAAVDFLRTASTTVIVDIGDEELSGCRYDNGSFGAFTDPCPAVTSDELRVTGYIRIDNWND